MQTDVMQKVKCALIKVLKLNQGTELLAQSKLKDDLGLDSMSTLSFLMILEESIDGFVIDPDTLDTNHLDTVDSVMSYISNQLARAA